MIFLKSLGQGILTSVALVFCVVGFVYSLSWLFHTFGYWGVPIMFSVVLLAIMTGIFYDHNKRNSP